MFVCLWFILSIGFLGEVLTLFFSHSSPFVKSPFEDIVVILKFDGELGGELDPDVLIATASSLKVKNSEIDALHKEFQESKK